MRRRLRPLAALGLLLALGACAGTEQNPLGNTFVRVTQEKKGKEVIACSASFASGAERTATGVRVKACDATFAAASSRSENTEAVAAQERLRMEELRTGRRLMGALLGVGAAAATGGSSPAVAAALAKAARDLGNDADLLPDPTAPDPATDGDDTETEGGDTESGTGIPQLPDSLSFEPLSTPQLTEIALRRNDDSAIAPPDTRTTRQRAGKCGTPGVRREIVSGPFIRDGRRWVTYRSCASGIMRTNSLAYWHRVERG